MNKQFYYGLALFAGTIIGVGMFGIPFVFSKAGIALGLFYLALITVILTILHLMYGEVILRTEGVHRLPGYAEKYLGTKWKKVVGFSNVLSFSGTLIAYIIIGGEFLNIIFSQFSINNPLIWSTLFFLTGAWLIFRDIRFISKTELYLNTILIFAIILISGFALSHFEISNLKIIDLKKFFLPYGVILFALSGASAIPELKDVISNDLKKAKKILIIGTILPAIIYAIFAIAIVGATGARTSEEAISGLANILGSEIAILGALVGFLAVFTSYIVIGLNLKKVFWYDYNINKNLSWALSSLIPFSLFLLGIKNFILIIGIIGTIFGGFEGIITILIYLKSKKLNNRIPEYSLKIPKIIAYTLMLIFILGIIYELIYL